MGIPYKLALTGSVQEGVSVDDGRRMIADAIESAIVALQGIETNQMFVQVGVGAAVTVRTVGAEEELKHKAAEFGGWQSDQLSSEDIKRRLCCARYCGWSGMAQVPSGLLAGGYRVVCKVHLVLLAVMNGALLGSPAPVDRARELADHIGMDWHVILDREPKQPGTPESFCCLRCGGGMVVETVGMLKGKRFIHTCEES